MLQFDSPNMFAFGDVNMDAINPRRGEMHMSRHLHENNLIVVEKDSRVTFSCVRRSFVESDIDHIFTTPDIMPYIKTGVVDPVVPGLSDHSIISFVATVPKLHNAIKTSKWRLKGMDNPDQVEKYVKKLDAELVKNKVEQSLNSISSYSDICHATTKLHNAISTSLNQVFGKASPSQ